jgi:osmotically-inducible protein OsmY
MTMTQPSPTDTTIREAVRDELEWAPDVHGEITVEVADGTVTLTGVVNDLAERRAALGAALRVRGVSLVCDALTVDHQGLPRTDTEVAARVHNVLMWTTNLPRDAVRFTVRDHVVRVTGTLDWEYQRQAVQHAIECIVDVARVDNQITLSQRPVAAPDTRERILCALLRNALIDATRVEVEVSGAEVTLTGIISTWDEMREVDRVAWSSPHVAVVRNEIVVRGL